MVSPLGKPHRYKQHHYALVNDTEAMRPTILSAAKVEVHSILQALIQIEKNLESHKIEAEKMNPIMSKTRQFYEEMDKILDLMSQYPLKELIEILESKKK